MDYWIVYGLLDSLPITGWFTDYWIVYGLLDSLPVTMDGLRITG